MKRVAIVWTLWTLCVVKGHSQKDTSRGIDFEKKADWQEILERAQKEHKGIFVDCYASWCGPCKWMDQHVYGNDTVGEIINQDFIAVRLQMDTTARDAPEVRMAYAIAHMLGKKYRIRAYPSFLFFSSDGTPLHKSVGAKEPEDFISLIKAAQEPEKQYYTLLDRYRNGRLEAAGLPGLARAAKKIEEDSLANVVAKDYLFNDLAKTHQPGIWRKEDLDFMRAYVRLIHWGDPLSRMYVAERQIVDSVLGGPGKSNGMIDAIVYNDEVLPRVNSGIQCAQEPNWRNIERTIDKRYGDRYAAGNLLKGRIEYYKARKEWANYSKYFVKQIKAAKIQNWPEGIMTSYVLNNDAFEVFQHSTDKHDLEKALTWVERALAMNPVDPEALDTKANLLYKLGRKNEGLVLEEKSFKMAPSNREIGENYAKMKSGLPTW